MNELAELIRTAGAELTLPAGAEYETDAEIVIDRPLKLHGCGAKITGRGQTAFLIKSSDVEMDGLDFSGVSCAVRADSFGGVLENLKFSGISVLLTSRAFLFCSTESNGIIRNITVEDCTMKGLESWSSDEGAALIPIGICAAKIRDGGPRTVTDTLAENIEIKNCRVTGCTRLAFSVATSVPVNFFDGDLNYAFGSNVCRNIRFVNNNVELCWDSPFNIMAGFGNSRGDVIENVLIEGNELGFGISGCYLYAGEPMFGTGEDSRCSGVVIRNNHFRRGIEDVGEPSRGLFLGACRGDYWPGACARRSTLEDVKIFGNTFEGAGIVIVGIYTLLDGDMLFEDNTVQRVEIYGNRILNAEAAFTFEVAQPEGRIYDWNFGYPRHEKRWAADITDHSVRTVKFVNNRIRELYCHDNVVDGYRYKVIAAGADLRGHAYAEGNKISEGIRFENNVYKTGEMHLRVAGFIGEDYAVDGGGNEAAEEFRR